MSKLMFKLAGSLLQRLGRLKGRAETQAKREFLNFLDNRRHDLKEHELRSRSDEEILRLVRFMLGRVKNAPPLPDAGRDDREKNAQAVEAR